MLLITNGCSFSECAAPPDINFTWPRHVAQDLGLSEVHSSYFDVKPSDAIHQPLAMGSQGNGQISRKTIYTVDRHLKNGVPPEDIRVIVMWSGPDRGDFYIPDRRDRSLYNFKKNKDGWVENPTVWPKEDDHGGWIIQNCHWTHPSSTRYYRFFHSDEWSFIQSLEHYLRLQWYLESVGIQWAALTYTGECFQTQMKHNPSVSYLWNMIDWNRYPETVEEYGCWEWCRDNTKLPKQDPVWDARSWNHPIKRQYGAYIQKVGWPLFKRLKLFEKTS